MDSRLTVAENRVQNERLVDAWLTWLLAVRHREHSTVAAYRRAAASLTEFLGDTPLESADVEQLEAWVTRSRRGRALGRAAAASTQAKDVSVARGLYDWLVVRGHISTNPAQRLLAPAVRNVAPKPVPPERWVTLWAHAREDDGASVTLGLMFFTGLRRGEVARLRPEHIDLRRQLVRGYLRKGGDEDSTPYGDLARFFEARLPHLIPGGAASFIRPLERMARERHGRQRLLPFAEHRPAPPGERAKHALGPRDVGPETISSLMRVWLHAAGLPRDSVSPHQLRHGTATYLLEAGVPLHLVSRLLHHADSNMTMRYVRAGAHEFSAWVAQQPRS